MQKLWIKAVIVLFCLTLVLLFTYCRENISGSFNENIPPETEIFVKSAVNDTLNSTTSIQTIYWDGRDPDGFVVGFYYTWEQNPGPDDWIWTSERSKSFPLQISGNDTSYLFQIKAVDNLGAEDPTPAFQLFPIRNTPPVISWTPASLIPDTTFTVASFVWAASDLDGDHTISHFEYALDDTSQWKKCPGFRRTLTLTADSGVVAGDHVFYIRAVDIAGARSPVIRMPENKTWHVKNPKGRYLLIDDFLNEAQSGYPDAYYRSMLTEVLVEIGNGDQFDYWNIEEQFPVSRIQFTETMKLFDRIIWYTDLIQQNDQRFITAQIAIPEYLFYGRDDGDVNRKIIYTVQFNQGFGSQGNPLEFSPVDSLGVRYNFINNGSRYYPLPDSLSSFYSIFGLTLPELQVNRIILGLAALKPRVTALPLYYYDDPAKEDDPLFILLGLNDNKAEKLPVQDAYDFLFSGTPLHYLQGNANLNEFFKIILKDVFKP